MRKILSAAVFAALMGTSGLAHAVDLKISHVRPQGSTIDTDLHQFSDLVKKDTNGDLNIKIFAASALGDYTVVQQGVSVGAIDMSVQPPATDADRRMQIASMPYVATNWKEAHKIYGPGSILNKTMYDLFQKQDITVLAAYPVYFGGISLNVDPVSPGATDEKGIKIRVPGIKSFQLTGEALGYIPSPIPFSDAYTSIQTGVVDGVIGSGAEGYYSSFRDVTKAYLPVNDHFEIWYMIISNQSLNELSKEDQAALKKDAADFEAKRWTTAEEDTAHWEKMLKESGATIVPISDEQREAMAAKVRKTVWPAIIKDLGEKWAEPIFSKMTAK